jgi:hypothetical protein
MNKCEAPESNSTTAGCQFIRNLPAVTTSSRNFLNSGIVNMPRACIALVVVLWRIRTILGPVARLIAIPARTITWWHLGVALPQSSVALAKTRLGLVLLLRWGTIPDVGRRWTILSLICHRSLGL